MEKQDILQALTGTNILVVISIILVAWLLIYISERFLEFIARKVPTRWRLFVLGLTPIIRLIIIIKAIILIVPRLVNPTFENLVAILGALAVAIGFAFKDYVSSLIAGLVTLYEASYRPGDWIELKGYYGEVKRINMRSVELLTPDDDLIIVPHQTIWSEVIVNSSGGAHSILCKANFYLNPEHDGILVRQVLYDVALTSALIRVDNPISVSVQDHAWGTQYSVKAFVVDARKQSSLVSDLTLRGKAALMALNVKFANVEPEPEGTPS